MSDELINLSPDLKKLRDEGYEIEVRNGLLLVHHIPYANSGKTVGFGALVSTLNLAGEKTTKPETHVIHFMGNFPCNADGTPIEQLRHSDAEQQLGDGIVVQHSFSCKPDAGYADYYQKVKTYIQIIAGPAKALNPNASARTFIAVASEDEQIFKYSDTNSSRAGILSVTDKLRGQTIGIIGLGGTGSYVLDFVAKTPVKEIHLFDGDDFLQHNAFRAPGAPALEQLRQERSKVAYFGSLYSAMRKGIVPHEEYITKGNLDDLAAMDFVFICVDRDEIKGPVVEYLTKAGVSFVDVGISVEEVDGSLQGILRTTTSTKDKQDHIKNRISLEGGEEEEDDYASNIQISELNAMNAAFAVIKWKKLSGFYHDFANEHNTTYTLDTGEVINADET